MQHLWSEFHMFSKLPLLVYSALPISHCWIMFQDSLIWKNVCHDMLKCMCHLVALLARRINEVSWGISLTFQLHISNFLYVIGMSNRFLTKPPWLFLQVSHWLTCCQHSMSAYGWQGHISQCETSKTVLLFTLGCANALAWHGIHFFKERILLCLKFGLIL